MSPGTSPLSLTLQRLQPQARITHHPLTIHSLLGAELHWRHDEPSPTRLEPSPELHTYTHEAVDDAMRATKHTLQQEVPCAERFNSLTEHFALLL